MAEQKLLKLIISRVDGPVLDGEVISVSVPGVDGDMTILAEHEALISPLRKGTVSVLKADGEVETFEVESGTLEISNNSATILI
ncbi:MAG: F-type H+-transporting ATPase subunit epsilon [Candidatus Azotimanducaceae bacterium]|jgi:F-type H+-transporting ATPase subunit epsilon